jgi:hypothetical protein
MRTVSIVSALALAASVFACSSASSDGSADQGSEQDVTAAKVQLTGSWVVDTASAEETSVVALELRPNGDFWRDENQILNGVMIGNAPRPVHRDTGTYSVDTSAHTVTLTYKPAGEDESVSETMHYAYKAARILNGMFLPGQEPNMNATLTLTGIAAPGSHIAFPAIQYDQQDSYCTSDKDCDSERSDKSWKPDQSIGGMSQCDQTNRVCNAVAAQPEN